LEPAGKGEPSVGWRLVFQYSKALEFFSLAFWNGLEKLLFIGSLSPLFRIKEQQQNQNFLACYHISLVIQPYLINIYFYQVVIALSLTPGRVPNHKRNAGRWRKVDVFGSCGNGDGGMGVGLKISLYVGRFSVRSPWASWARAERKPRAFVTPGR
jgi:hypothetical protein